MPTASGLSPSLRAQGNADDHAVAESFFSTLKNALVHHCDFVTSEQARSAIFEYIEIFSNRPRRTRRSALSVQCRSSR